MHSETSWRFFTDAVMGGLSTGRLAFGEEEGQPHARMTGHVSTANRGGFIQLRKDLATPPPEGTTGVRLVVRGNGQRYFVHLRTDETRLPWQYYQAGFDAPPGWTEVTLPFADFHAAGAPAPSVLRPARITSLGIVAFGRDHDADISVRSAGFV